MYCTQGLVSCNLSQVSLSELEPDDYAYSLAVAAKRVIQSSAAPSLSRMNQRLRTAEAVNLELWRPLEMRAANGKTMKLLQVKTIGRTTLLRFQHSVVVHPSLLPVVGRSWLTHRCVDRHCQPGGIRRSSTLLYFPPLQSELPHGHDDALSIIPIRYEQMGTSMMVRSGDDWNDLDQTNQTIMQLAMVVNSST